MITAAQTHRTCESVPRLRTHRSHEANGPACQPRCVVAELFRSRYDTQRTSTNGDIQLDSRSSLQPLDHKADKGRQNAVRGDRSARHSTKQPLRAGVGAFRRRRRRARRRAHETAPAPPGPTLGGPWRTPLQVSSTRKSAGALCNMTVSGCVARTPSGRGRLREICHRCDGTRHGRTEQVI